MQGHYFEKKYTGSFSPKDIRFVIYDAEIWKACKVFLKKSKIVADFGSGGGTLLYNVAKITDAKLIGIEQAESAIAISKKLIPRYEARQEDVLKTSLKNESIGFVLSTMTIEHVDENKFVSEIYRTLKPGGYFLVTSIMKNNFAWYFYKNARGVRVLEPTHLKEYRSIQELEKLLESFKFTIIKSTATRIKFPLIDPLLKTISRIAKSDLFCGFASNKPVETFRLMTRIPVPGYFALEILAQKVKELPGATL